MKRWLVCEQNLAFCISQLGTKTTRRTVHAQAPTVNRLKFFFPFWASKYARPQIFILGVISSLRRTKKGGINCGESSLSLLGLGLGLTLTLTTLYHISNNKYVYELNFSANILDIHNRRYISRHIVFNRIVLDADARKEEDDIAY